MSKLPEKIVYNTVGTIKIASDKFKELLEDLIQNNQYTEDEGKRIVQDITIQIEQFSKELQLRIQIQVDETIEKIQTPVREQVNLLMVQLRNQIQEFSLNKILGK